MKIRVSKITGITPHRESIYSPIGATPFGDETRNDYLVVECEMQLFEMEMAVKQFREKCTVPEWAELVKSLQVYPHPLPSD